MADLTVEEKREFFVEDTLKVWREHSDWPFAKKIWETVTRTMQFVGHYQDWEGADKKAEVLKILEGVLDKTDSPGPDFIVDWIIGEAAEFGVDYLYDAFKGKFAFDGPTVEE